MPFAIIDTGVYVRHWEGALDDQALATVPKKFVVRQSCVIWSELRRGARIPQARRLVEQLPRMTKVHWTPDTADWWKAGVLIQRTEMRMIAIAASVTNSE